jgi:competence protein ComEC
MRALQFPLSIITLFFISGIVAGFYWNPKPETIFYSLLCCFILFCITHFSKKHSGSGKHFKFQVFMLSMILGTATQVSHNAYYQSNNYIHVCNDFQKFHNIKIRLDEKLKSSLRNHRYIAWVKQIDNQAASGKILVNIKRDSVTQNLEIGSVLLLNTKIFKHRAPNNPGQFDYGNYLANKSVFAQLYFSENEILSNPRTDKTIWHYASAFRQRIVSNLEAKGFENESLQVLLALILGQQQEISQETLHDYQFAGAVHVLSVSGLHVGFILLFINFLLSKVPKTKTGNLLRFFAVFTGLWSFAIIAGLSPSVVRSVTMFCFVAFGMYLKRETNIFHTLLVSGLFILMASPSFLFDVGFQLSYVSLFFILWLQPMFAGLWNPKYKILSYFWDILTVSVAAQIGALPLSIYYFHQFPGLFFLTNLIILPALGIIMAVGVVVILMASINYVPEIPMKILEWKIISLNRVIKWIASFEDFIIQDIPLNTSLLIAFYGLIVFAVFWIKKPDFKHSMSLMLMVIVLQIIVSRTIETIQAKEEFIVFHFQKTSAVLKNSHNKIAIYSTAADHNSKWNENAIKSYLINNFAEADTIQKLKNVYFFKGSRVLAIDSLAVFPKNIKPDIILLTQSPKVNLERIVLSMHPQAIVADGSNQKSYIKLWQKTCRENKIPFHATAEKGFYKLE